MFKNTLGIVFLGTPHTASNSTALLKVLRYAQDVGDIPAELLSEKPILSSMQRVQLEFEDLCSSNVRNFKTVSFYEELPVPGIGLVIIICPEIILGSDLGRSLTDKLFALVNF